MIFLADSPFWSSVIKPLRTKKQPRLSRTELERAKTISPCSQRIVLASAPRVQRSAPVFLAKVRSVKRSARAMELRSPEITDLLDMKPSRVGRILGAAPWSVNRTGGGLLQTPSGALKRSLDGIPRSSYSLGNSAVFPGVRPPRHGVSDRRHGAVDSVLSSP